MKAPPLQYNKSTIGEVAVRPIESTSFSDVVTVTTSPTFGRNETNILEWLVAMKIVFTSGGEKPIPYEGHIEVSGIFTLAPDVPDDKQLKIIAVTSPSMLYATAREIIAGITARSRNGIFLLPSVSFIDGDLRLDPPRKPPGIEVQ